MALTENPTLVQIVDEIERLNNLIIDRGGARTIIPSTSNQVLNKGNYKGDITVLGDSDLVAENIKKGANIFGVNGLFEGGKKWAMGEATLFREYARFSNDNNLAYVNKINVSGLSFKPFMVVITSTSGIPLDGCVTIGGQYGATSNGRPVQMFDANKPIYIDDEYCYLANDGFRLPAHSFNPEIEGMTVRWFAFE